MLSVLSKARIGDVETVPFPHLVIRDALEPSYYDSLMSTFPSVETVNAQNRSLTNNDATFLGATEVRESAEIPDQWKEFFQAHTSKDFLAEALGLLKKPVIDMHPTLAPVVSDLRERKVALADSGEKADFYIQCQFGVNSSVQRESSVRTAHIDNPRKIYNALLYCRAPDDDSEGGDLVFYRFKDEPGFYGRRTALPNRIEEAGRVPYEANTLVLFANSVNSVHGVTPRKPTPHVRRYINFQVELDSPIFDIPYVSRAKSLVERMLG